MYFRYVLTSIFLVLISMGLSAASCQAADRVPITIKQHVPGAPITMGIPFPKGALYSPEHVRLLSAAGDVVPSQVTEVTSWAPADSSLKWVWVFFFADEGDTYQLEYGDDVQRAPIPGDRVVFVNNQRPYGATEITTGPLRLQVAKRGSGGFLDQVFLDTEGDGFEDDDVVAVGTEGRGSFLDLLDEVGVDTSRAVVTQTFKERGSGPLHAVLRIEGEYRYTRDDNNAAPFVTRIHAYAGKSYIRVLHTITYTGVPDQHTPQEGQHAAIATRDGPIIDEAEAANDPGWTEPNDQIAGAGLQLDYRLNGPLTYRTAYRDGAWWAPGDAQPYEMTVDAEDRIALLQTGPDPTRIPPVANSTATERIGGFAASILRDGTPQVEATTTDGWIDVTGADRGVAIGIRNYLKEYPKELRLDVADQRMQAYIWSPEVEPMSFERWSTEEDGGMVGNFAQGLTKTTELVYHFHAADGSAETTERTLQYVLEPPVAHVPPDWYADSRVYGRMAARQDAFAEFERGLDYKYDWWLYNQDWEPWYGMIDYGDGKNYYFREDWYQYANNEPAMDFMFWMQFMRTGNRDYYLAGEAMSRHTMDVDNTHWPTNGYAEYRGDTNDALDWWRAKKDSSGSPYLGMGRRHGDQQWTSMLSAHVWVPGWVAAYYLAGYHRGLDIARLTADYYQRRIFGKHGLTGRRLYLSVWNLVEIYDATKDEQYLSELTDRVDRMLALQNEQGGSLVIDRYGYAHVYVARGLGKYYQITGDERVREALIRHARWVRDNPPLNHEMESYLSSISTLLLGYQLSGNESLYTTALDRAQVLKTGALATSFDEAASQGALFEALEAVSNLPPARSEWRPRAIWSLTHGLRVFGWTHAYNVPYLVYWLRAHESASEDASVSQ
jgi:hypothetical protein